MQYTVETKRGILVFLLCHCLEWRHLVTVLFYANWQLSSVKCVSMATEYVVVISVGFCSLKNVLERTHSRC